MSERYHDPDYGPLEDKNFYKKEYQALSKHLLCSIQNSAWLGEMARQPTPEEGLQTIELAPAPGENNFIFNLYSSIAITIYPVSENPIYGELLGGVELCQPAGAYNEEGQDVSHEFIELFEVYWYGIGELSVERERFLHDYETEVDQPLAQVRTATFEEIMQLNQLISNCKNGWL